MINEITNKQFTGTFNRWVSNTIIESSTTYYSNIDQHVKFWSDKAPDEEIKNEIISIFNEIKANLAESLQELKNKIDHIIAILPEDLIINQKREPKVEPAAPNTTYQCRIM